MKKIAIIGGGNMGEALIKRLHQKYSVFVCEANLERKQYLQQNYQIKTGGLEKIVPLAQVIIIAVKPQDIDNILAELSAHISAEKLVVSIAAGVTSSYIEKKLRQRSRVIRTMPNMPAQIGEGITAISQGRYAKAADVEAACKIFNEVGETVVVHEDWIDAITAVSGSGPAYVFLFVECMINAAKALGLSESLSKKLVYKTLSGSTHLLEGQKLDAAALRVKVTSKGGTTRAAMDIFFKQHLDKIFKQALAAAKKRAGELSKK